MMEFLEVQQILSPYPSYEPKLEPVTPKLVSDTSAALKQNHIRMVLVDGTRLERNMVVQLFRRASVHLRPVGHFVIWTSSLGPL